MFGIHSLAPWFVVVLVVHKMFGMNNICSIIVVCHFMDWMRIWNQYCSHGYIICFVFIFDQFILRDCEYYRNYHITNWTYIVQYFFGQLYDKMVQLLSDVIWFIIILCDAIFRTQWLRRLSGILEICISIHMYYESMDAFDCKLMQHLLCTAFPVIAIQTSVILGIIIIMKVYVFGLILSRYYSDYTFCWKYSCYHLVCVLLSMDCDHQFMTVEFMLHYCCCNYQDCRSKNCVVIHWIHIDCYFLIKLCHKMMQSSDVIWIMITLCLAMLHTQWLTWSPGILEICIELNNAFDCKCMQHLLCIAFPVYAMIQTFSIFGIIMILLINCDCAWIDIIGYYNYYTFCWNYICCIIIHQVLFSSDCDIFVQQLKFVMI